MRANPSSSFLRSVRLVCLLLLLPFGTVRVSAQPPAAAVPKANQAAQELAKLRAELASVPGNLLRNNKLWPGQPLTWAARTELAGNKAALVRVQADSDPRPTDAHPNDRRSRSPSQGSQRGAGSSQGRPGPTGAE